MLFNFFHDHTKELSDNPANMDDWPEEWKRTQYKIYDGADTIELRTNFNDDLRSQSLFKLITERESKRNFINTPILFDELSVVLKYSASQHSRVVTGTEGVLGRMYSSAGARYPLEIYVILRENVVSNDGSCKVTPGLYHYNVAEELLERLDGPDNIPSLLQNTIHLEWARVAPICVCITGVFDRTMDKYGYRGYRFILQEVGFVHGLLSLTCEALGLSAVPIGAFNDRALEHFIDIDGVSESILSVCVIGKTTHE